MVHSSAFFNNKGGVGKTTSIANLGNRLAALGHRVVVVDLDPQCNMTQYFLSDAQWEGIYLDSKSSADQTIWKFVRPISQSKSIDIDSALDITLWEGRFGFDLVAGHPFVSRLDDALAEAWGNLRQAKVGGIETTYWCHLLVNKLEEQIPELEYVLFDLGPSLGPLNRSVILACNSFISPVSPDLFSLYSFDNLKTWFTTLKRSLNSAKIMLEEDPENPSDCLGYDNFMEGVTVRSVGYISQQYITRTTRGEKRMTRAFQRFLQDMPTKANELNDLLQGGGLQFDSPDIGVMPHMYSMVSLAHEAHAPIADLSGSDGLNGAQFRQRDRYVEDMDEICVEWIRRMEAIDER